MMEKAFYKTAAWTEFAKAKLICVTAQEHERAAATNPAVTVDDFEEITREAQAALTRFQHAQAQLVDEEEPVVE